MMRWIMCVVALAGIPGAPLLASHREDEGRRVFFLAEERVVVMDLRIEVDEMPLEAAWDQFLDQQFRDADVNGDGVLTGGEIDRLPNRSQLQAFNVLPRSAAGPRSPDSRPAHEKVTREELGEYYKRLGFELLHLPSPAPNEAYVGRGEGEMAEAGDESAAAAALFARLDADANERLTAKELADAAYSLRKWDLDRDGSISAMELSPGRRGRLYGSGVFTMSPSPQRPRMLMVTPDRPARTLVAELLAVYDRPQRGQSQPDGRLSREEIGLSPAGLARADMDDNGFLDFEELQQFLAAPTPEITLIVRLGRRSGDQPAVEIRGGEEAATTADGAGFRVGKTQLEFATDSNNWGDPAEAWRPAFKALDRDANGYLDAAEMKSAGVEAALASAVDSDGDGLVYEKELLAVVAPLAVLLRNRVELQIRDQGRDLFRLLDAGGDGRLGPRDFRAATDRLPHLDADGDGVLELAEIPRIIQLRAARGVLDAFGASDSLGVWAITNRGGGLGVATAPPEWFVRMDRNNDGDVARGEFLGPLEKFSAFDADGDGLLSGKEAASAGGS